MISSVGCATPSLLAHIASDKLCDGLPLHRQEDRVARLGVRIDRGSMSRWLEDLGMSVGTTIVAAMRAHAFAHAFCIATDATGVLVQTIPGGDKQRRACTRGHYFVQIADADHVCFEYTAKETSASVGELFRGFSGYIQADAKSVYDFLLEPPDQRQPPDDGTVDDAVRHEVGCSAHARRTFWEAAITKDVVAREALVRIMRIFEIDRRGESCRPPRSSRFARSTCDRTPTHSSRGSRPSTSAFAISADCSAPRSAARTDSAVRSPGATTTVGSSFRARAPPRRCRTQGESSSAATTMPKPPATS